MNAYLRLARPKQWLKNVLVFAAPGAAGVLDEPNDMGLALLAFAAMCLAASGTYYWNDALDVEADRAHPTKSKRPIAAGEVSLNAGRLVGSVLLLGALGVAAVTGRWQTVAIVGTYIAVTLSYSAIWKHIAVIDLVAIASGLRAPGCVLGRSRSTCRCRAGSCSSPRSARCSSSPASASPRSRELGDGAQEIRSTLGEYSEAYLRFVLGVTCAGALVSYCVWAFERRDLTQADFPWYELSIVPVMTAFLRYALMLDQGHGAAPEEVFVGDRVLQLLGLVWIAIFAIAVYA